MRRLCVRYRAVCLSWLATVFVLVLGPAAGADETFPGRSWIRPATPEAAGWSSPGLAAVHRKADAFGSTEIVIVHHGVMVDSWGDVAARSEAYSVRKSLLSALVGIAVTRGQIELGATMEALGVDDNPPLTAAEKQATVKDLLQARSGIYHPALYETPRMARERPTRGSHPHGTFWYYNNWDFNALGTIYEKKAGEKIFEAIARNLAKPLQMEDFTAVDGRYVSGPESKHPAYPMRMSARDLARFGLLYLREGRWKDRQVVPAAWVRESTSGYSETGRNSFYGYMWWTAKGATCFPGATAGERCFFAAGNYGQYVAVIPTRDLVIVHRVDTDRSQTRVNRTAFGELMALIMAAGGKAVQ